MPPKKKKNEQIIGRGSKHSIFEKQVRKVIDHRLDEQSKQINYMFEKYSKMTKLNLNDVKKSQEFLAAN